MLDTDNRNKIYFASDFHLGVPSYEDSLVREKRLVRWFDFIKQDAKEIYLMGDIFDFWFEYDTVVPKGYTRLFGKLAEITDSGIPIYLYKGNHDMWAFEYFEQELNIKMFRDPTVKTFNNKKFYIAHGDGLGKGDHGYKFLKKVFEFKPNQWLFRWMHPDLSIKFALFWSRRSRKANIKKGTDKFFDKKKERLFKFAEEYTKIDDEIDFFIFGHRHIPVILPVGEKVKYINLGDWITNFSYAVFDGEDIELKVFE